MKKIVLSAVTMVAMSTLSFAGGDIDPVEPVVVEPMAVENGSGLYLGLGIAASSTGIGTLSTFSENYGQDRTGDIVLQAGYEVNQYFAVEGRYTTSVSAEDFIEREAWGVYLKPQYPVNTETSVYALIGYGDLSLNGATAANVSLDEDGFQWGIGASYDLTSNVSTFIDYVSVVNDVTPDAFPFGTEDISSASVTLGLTYTF